MVDSAKTLVAATGRAARVLKLDGEIR